MVTYNNTFGKHDINALFVYEQYEGTTDWMDGQRNYFISSAVDQLFAGSSDPKNSTLNGKGSESGPPLLCRPPGIYIRQQVFAGSLFPL